MNFSRLCVICGSPLLMLFLIASCFSYPCVINAFALDDRITASDSLLADKDQNKEIKFEVPFDSEYKVLSLRAPSNRVFTHKVQFIFFYANDNCTMQMMWDKTGFTLSASDGGNATRISTSDIFKRPSDIKIVLKQSGSLLQHVSYESTKRVYTKFHPCWFGFNPDFENYLLDFNMKASSMSYKANPEGDKCVFAVEFNHLYESSNSSQPRNAVPAIPSTTGTDPDAQSGKEKNESKRFDVYCLQGWMYTAITESMLFLSVIVCVLVYYGCLVRRKQEDEEAAVNYITHAEEELQHQSEGVQPDKSPAAEVKSATIDNKEEEQKKMIREKLRKRSAEAKEYQKPRKGAEKKEASSMDVLVSLDSHSKRKVDSALTVPAKVKGYVPKKDVQTPVKDTCLSQLLSIAKPTLSRLQRLKEASRMEVGANSPPFEIEPLSLSLSPSNMRSSIDLLVPDRKSFSFRIISPENCEYPTPWVEVSIGEMPCQLKFSWLHSKSLYIQDCHASDEEDVLKLLSDYDSKEYDKSHMVGAVDCDNGVSDVTVLYVSGQLYAFTEATLVSFVPVFDLDFGVPLTTVFKYATKFSMSAENVKCDLAVFFSEKYQRSNLPEPTPSAANVPGESVTPSANGSSGNVNQAGVSIAGCAWMWIAIVEIIIFIILVIAGVVYYVMVIRPKRQRPVKFNYVDGSMDEANSERLFMKASEGAAQSEGVEVVQGADLKDKVEEAKTTEVKVAEVKAEEVKAEEPETVATSNQTKKEGSMDVLVSLDSNSKKKILSASPVPAKVKGYIPKKDVHTPAKGYVPKPAAVNCQVDFVQTPVPKGGKPVKKKPKREQ
uniref:Uncharacterized protein n=1 Tax=Ditylenchus dipsaci TaxID=166011 RepID=A0A915EEC5_9BILA